MPTPKLAPPTKEQFTAYERMFVHFNRQLFRNTLPTVLLNFSRRAKTNGVFFPERWNRGRTVKHEISLNPATLKVRRPIEVASTLVHEMTHLWQHTSGSPSRTGYHNREWGDKMEALGLMPSSTAAPGGARVGQRVSHYIIAGGPFELAFKSLPKDALLPWVCAPEPEGKAGKAATRNKVKYTCPECEVNAWGKPKLNLWCGDCEQPFDEAEEG